MKNLLKQWFVLGLSLTVFAACEKKDPVPIVNQYPTDTNKTEAFAGIFISNEGPFGSGNGTVSFYDRKTGVVKNDLFENVNGYPLGNIVQSVSVHNGKGYVVVNNANKVEVVTISDFKSAGSITGLNSPRYFLGIDKNKAYVTEWGASNMDGFVKVIDLTTNTVKSTITTGKGAENMLKINDLVYVTCKGGYGNDSVVTVINTTTDAVVNTITVGPNPSSMQLDAFGKIWVLCAGQYKPDYSALEKSGRLVRVNPTTNTVEQSFNFSSDQSQPFSLCINSSKNTLYYSYEGKVFKLDVSATALNTTGLIKRNFYGLGVDPSNNYIYGADAKDYSSKGWVLRYNSIGNIVDSFQVGVIPNGFYFN